MRFGAPGEPPNPACFALRGSPFAAGGGVWVCGFCEEPLAGYRESRRYCFEHIAPIAHGRRRHIESPKRKAKK
ncbi:hypothetical protein WS71_31890 [Burkholderia mayonis]|uniref:Uncharacterized protein n=1 Tax=Burkholderia mayonis TaxID=1385591 RepID=A0A1B4G6U9_9BURK|nr:hypothetical protein WS71_31890 [Burkholderia mayonis]KVE54551.1 hypothetical protein WS71_03750 [Burkholderia mayonis]